MDVNPLAITPIDQRYTPGASTSKGSELDRNDFLRLLVSQLSNQDPLNPMEGQEFAAQLAQFSSVEQLINIDETLAIQGEFNGMLATSMNNGVAAGLIGKQVEAPGDSLSWDGDTATGGYLTPETATENTQILIRDPSGLVVRTLDMGSLSASGQHEFSWDGKDESGSTVQTGAYSFEVVSTDSNGESVPTEATLRGEVTRVTFASDGVRLFLGEVSVLMSAVRSVTEGN